MGVTPAEISCTAEDGVSLFVRMFRPRGTPSGAVLCGHAMMTDGAYFNRLAAFLAEKGWLVAVPDFRGHGKSGLRAHHGGEWTFDDLVEKDWPAFRHALSTEAACRQDELAVIGHSLGGLVTTAARTAQNVVPHRTLFLTTNTWMLPNMRGLEKLRAKIACEVFRFFVSRGAPIPVRKLGMGTEDEPAAYFRQFLQWADEGRLVSLGGVDYRAGLAEWPKPAVSIAGTGDWMCPLAGARDFMAPTGGRIPVYAEGRVSGLTFDPNHFQLVTKEGARPFWERAAHFLASGGWPLGS